MNTVYATTKLQRGRTIIKWQKTPPVNHTVKGPISDLPVRRSSEPLLQETRHAGASAAKLQSETALREQPAMEVTFFFPTAWCGFPAKINTNLHIVHAASHPRCQQHFVWFLNVFTSSLQFMLSVLPEMISFSFCPISTFLISLLSLWLLFVYICLKFPLPLTTYRLNSLPRQFCSAVNGGPVSILKQKAVF